jgi:hypothetical protein
MTSELLTREEERSGFRTEKVQNTHQAAGHFLERVARYGSVLRDEQPFAYVA